MFIARYILAAVFLPLIAARAASVRWDTKRRKATHTRPRLIFGPTPIISIAYIASALRTKGYQAETFVYDVYSINATNDYDHVLPAVLERYGLVRWFGNRLARALGPYLAFMWLLPRYDIFHFFFEGGFLQATPLHAVECWLLHLAAKRIVVMPYGSDVAIPSQIRSLPFRHGLSCHYPHLARCEDRTRNRIRHFTQHADFIVACILHGETLPKWDLLTTHYYPIDTDAWKPSVTPSVHDGSNGPVVIAHSPNHRELKGTRFLLDACDALRAEGLQVDLQILEKVPNKKVKQILERSDILVEQLLFGFGLSAMEGMALGKPVITNLSDDSYYSVQRLNTGLDECPLVSVTPLTLRDTLRSLIQNPQLRTELGSAGRDYVLAFHSFPVVANMWTMIYRQLWDDTPLSVAAWHPTRMPPVRAPHG